MKPKRKRLKPKERHRASLRSWLDKGWRPITTLLAGLALAAAVVSNLATLQQWWVDRFGKDDTTLTVRRARLIPYFAGFPDSIDRDQFSLQLELRNYSASPVVLTSADIAMTEAVEAKIGPGGSVSATGGCTLSSDPNEHQPIELAPGGSAWLGISPMVNLPGIRKWLDSDRLTNVHIVHGDVLAIRELKIVDELNAEFARRFGPNAKIRVNLFTGVHKKRRTLTFSLAQGKDLFAKDGSLMHDALISYWLSPNHKALNFDCRKRSQL